ncbi:hypothetical protein BCV70DRAFT_198550 [Testicularia cyperi]|uniref:Protein transport protein sec16 n=1 Tax=Testicularia cyperi TaxID=1882483 RepID=A0A317XWR6_9BASI|nr:hypothetical protein BCV70DRAFT_198550 [Testicularia cyperi]
MSDSDHHTREAASEQSTVADMNVSIQPDAVAETELHAPPIQFPAEDQQSTVKTTQEPAQEAPSSSGFLQAPVSVKRGHAPQPSVGIAASLFGSAGDDDPFSAIAVSSGQTEVGRADPFSASLNQLAEESESDFGFQHASDVFSDGVPPRPGSSKPQDAHVDDLFGNDGRETNEANQAAVHSSPVLRSLTVPGATSAQEAGNGDHNTGNSGPATPGGLFADSSYQDDWLQSGDQSAQQGGEPSQHAAADPFGASEGGQGSLSWLNSTDGSDGPQNSANAADQPDFTSGYAQSGQYDPQQYDAYGRPIDPIDYGTDNGGLYDQQGATYDPATSHQDGQYNNYDYAGQQTYASDTVPANDTAAGYEYDQKQAYGQQHEYDYYQQQEYAHTYDHQYQQQQDAHSYDHNAVYNSNTDAYQYGQYDEAYQPTDAAAATAYSQPQQQTQHGTHFNYDAPQVAPQNYDSYSSVPVIASSHAPDGQSSGWTASMGESYGYSGTEQPQSQDTYQYPAQHGESHSSQTHHDAYYGAQTYAPSQLTSPPQQSAPDPRVANPYDPPTATSEFSAASDTYAAPSSTQSLPPPPPRGPPRGGASRSASSNAHSAGASESMTTGQPPTSVAASANSVVSLEQESTETSSTSPTLQHDGQQSGQQQQRSQQRQRPVQQQSYSRRPPTNWVDSLEAAAASPPSTSTGADDSLPVLTITDEAGRQPHTGSHASGAEDRADGRDRHDAAHDAAGVDGVITAFDQLVLTNTTNDVDELASIEPSAQHVLEDLDGSALLSEQTNTAGEHGADSRQDGASSEEPAWQLQEGAVTTMDEEGLENVSYALPTSRNEPNEYNAYETAATDKDYTTSDATYSQTGAQGRVSPQAQHQQGWGDYGVSAQSRTGQEQSSHATTSLPTSSYDPYAPSSGQSHVQSRYSETFGAEDDMTSYDSNVSYGYGSFNTTHADASDPYTIDPYAPVSQQNDASAVSGRGSAYDAVQNADVAEDDVGAKTPIAAHGQHENWPGYGPAQTGEGHAANLTSDLYAPSSAASATTAAWNSERDIQGSDLCEDPYGPYPTGESATQARVHEPGLPLARPKVQHGDDRGYFGSDLPPSSSQRYPHEEQSGGTAEYSVPVSPYDPHGAAGSRSVAGDSAHSQAASESTSDMLHTMRSARIPLATFGVGGKLLTYFPGTSSTSAGEPVGEAAYGAYSYSASSYSTQIKLRLVSAVVPSSSFASAFDPLSFPGPVFEGVGSTNALSRATGAAAANKAKKAALIKHLDERVKDLSAGIGYLRRRPSFSGSARSAHSAGAGVAGLGKDNGVSEPDSDLEARRVEDKVLLLQLLKLLVENDGQAGSVGFEQGLRSLLVKAEAEESRAAATGFGAMSITAAFEMSSSTGDKVVSTHELRTDFLQGLQKMLLQGQRREAVDFAVSQKMWAHAMTIASCVDKDCWRVVVAQFIEQELGLAESALKGESDLQGLKVAYNVFSGQDPGSIFDLFRTKTQLNTMSSGLRPSTGVSGKESATGTTLPSWKDSVAIIASNNSTSDAAALTAIGDGLSTRDLIEAAHVCYLLSPQTSPVGGVDLAAVRLTLLGAPSPRISSAFASDLDGILMTEVFEYAQGLVPATKGQEAFPGIPHLQAYKLVHAHVLAELGEVGRALKYCEAIAHCLKACKSSPYLHPVLLTQLKQLSDRLTGAPHQGPGGNWVTRKMQRPTLDGVWGALEGRFTKFIAGEDGMADGDSPSKTNAGGSGGNGKGSVGTSSVGPFSHYSAITPDAASGGMTRQQSFADIGIGAHRANSTASPSVPSSRSGSAMDFRGASRRAASPKHRAASALSMRPLNSDPYSDWPQPSKAGSLQQTPSSLQDGASSSRNSFETNANGNGFGTVTGYSAGYGNDYTHAHSHGFQSSEYSAMSSTYEGPGETSYTSENAPWYGGGGRGVGNGDAHEIDSDAPTPNSDQQQNRSASNGNPDGDAYGGYGGYVDGYSGPYSGYGGFGEGDRHHIEQSGEDENAGDGRSPNDVPYYGYEPHGAQKPQFVSNVDSAALDGGAEGGFVSPFDALSSQNRTPQPRNNYAPASSTHHDDNDDDDDDLGLGNASTRKKRSPVANVDDNGNGAELDDSPRNSMSASTSVVDKDNSRDADSSKDSKDDKRQELKPSASWFGRLWGRSSSTDAPSQSQAAKAKKAHLGEEVTFYYDKDLKRWVNKKAGDSGAASTPPPPPPPGRAQTASPASQPDRSAGAASAPPMRRQSDFGPPQSGPPGPPSMRGASASYTIGRSTPPISEDREEGSSGLAPHRGPPGTGSLSRARSNLADHSMPPAAQGPLSRSGAATPGGGSSTPASLASPPPAPPGGSRAGTVKKRPIKNRYVVVD